MLMAADTPNSPVHRAGETLRQYTWYLRQALQTAWLVEQEAQLPRRDRATRYAIKLVLGFTSYVIYKGFKQQKWPSRSFKGNGAIR